MYGQIFDVGHNKIIYPNHIEDEIFCQLTVDWGKKKKENFFRYHNMTKDNQPKEFKLYGFLVLENYNVIYV